MGRVLSMSRSEWWYAHTDENFGALIMPVTTTFPGVYLERLPSGVRAIAGVSTSVAAFVGEASRGQVGVATRVLNFTDFDRGFGGLVSNYALGYAVRQFFVNGGSEAWIVRVAANPFNATLDLQATDGTVVLTLTALDAGDFGNSIKVAIDWKTASPDSTFNLTLTPSGNPGAVETFTGISLNSKDAKFVENVLSASQLVSAKRAAVAFPDPGTSTSGAIPDVQAALTPPAGQPPRTDFRVVINGLPAIRVSLAPGDFAGANNAARLTTLAAAIQAKVSSTSAAPAINGFTCAPAGNTLVLTSGTKGEDSSVRVGAGRQPMTPPRS